MEKLSVEEVKHVAHLARIQVTDEEIEKYRVSLAKLYNMIDGIHEIKGYNDDIMISPIFEEEEVVLRTDTVGGMVSVDEVLQNAPRRNGKFVEVPVVINE